MPVLQTDPLITNKLTSTQSIRHRLTSLGCAIAVHQRAKRQPDKRARLVDEYGVLWVDAITEKSLRKSEHRFCSQMRLCYTSVSSLFLTDFFLISLVQAACFVITTLDLH